MGGIVGRLLHEFSVTIAVAILISGFIALTLTPMLASRFLKYDPNGHRGIVSNTLETGFNAIMGGYDYTLQKVLRHRFPTLLMAFVTLGGTFYLFFTMPTGFIPSQDSGVISGPALGGQDISYEAMTTHIRTIADIALAESKHGPRICRRFRRQSRKSIHPTEAAFRTEARCRPCHPGVTT